MELDCKTCGKQTPHNNVEKGTSMAKGHLRQVLRRTCSICIKTTKGLVKSTEEQAVSRPIEQAAAEVKPKVVKIKIM